MLLRDYHTIKIEIEDEIGMIMLNQAPSNKMTREFFREFSDLLRDIEHMQEFKAMIISGSGRHYSQGADIEDLLEAFDHSDGQQRPAFFSDNRNTFKAIGDLRIPVISAIQGVCLGSALELAMFCHFRICARGALLALPEVSFNLIPGCGGTQRLPQLCGRERALQIMLEGENFSAEQALSWGIVDAVCDKSDLLPMAKSWAQKLKPGYVIEKRDHYLRLLSSS